jgi:hypothetical protein
MAAFTFLASKRLNRENHTKLGLMILAQSGDPKAVEKQFKDWEKDS